MKDLLECARSPDASVGIPTINVGTQSGMAYVYILKSREDGRYYIGSTTNIKERLSHHFGGHTPSTKKFGKLQLELAQEYFTLKEARNVERKLKKLKRRDYINKIVKEGFIKTRP